MVIRRSPALLVPLRQRAGRTLAALTAFAFAMTSFGGVLAPRAHASDLPRVLVAPYAPIYDSLPRTTGEKTAELLMSELRSSEQVQLVTMETKAAPAAPKAVNPTPRLDSGLLAEAKEHAAKADDLIKKLKFKPAVDELEKAISLYEGQHPYIDFSELVNAYLSLAVAYFRLSQDSEGEKLLAQVIRLDPDRKLDPEKYPPVFLRIFENMSGKVKRAPRGSLRVDPTSSGATVFLDGRELGKAPLLINDVIKGRHFVRVVPPSGDPWAQPVEITQGDTARLTPDLGAGAGPLAEISMMLSRNVIDEMVVTKALALANTAKAEYVVLGGVHKEGDTIVVSSHLLNVATHKLCLLQRVVFDGEMLGAGIEIYKVGADVANRVDLFGEDEKLPAKVARDAMARSGGSPAIATVNGGGSPESRGPVRQPAGSGRGPVGTKTNEPKISSDEPTNITVARRPDDAPRVIDTTPRTDVRNVVATPGDLTVNEPVGPGEAPEVKKSSNTVIWVLVGIAAAGALGVGGYYGYSYMTRPVTGTASVNW